MKRLLNNGRDSTRLKSRRGNKISGQFIAHRREMRNSPAWRALKGNDKLVLERLEEEHMAHGGCENGKLEVSYDQFEEFGIRRASIAVSLARVEGLGFVQCTDRGRAASAEFRFPARYRLTYLVGDNTDEWKRIGDDADATRAIERALCALEERSAPLRRKLKRVRQASLKPKEEQRA